MAYIGSEIVQSRIWIDPNEKPVPTLNYKLTYPITVFDAVRRDMYDEDSQTLTQALDNIYNELRGKQDIIPAKPANNLITYGGIAGVVGSIPITSHIPYDIDVMSDDKIPTEKAIGRLLQDYGIVPGSGGHIPDIVLWKDVVGRPTIYGETGDDENGVINQAALTSILNNIETHIDEILDDLDSTPLAARLRDHMNDQSNPHNVTPAIIGAVSTADFDNHKLDQSNPHGVTKTQVGLGNVDNTSDDDKPISRSTQAAINHLNELISNITGLIGDIRYVIDIQYTQSNGRLNVRYNDGSEAGVTIVTDGLIDEIIPDPEHHALIVQELNGTQTSIDLQTIIMAMIGSEGTHINIDINDDNSIHADIVPKSIRATEIADGSLINSLIALKTIGGDKIQDLTITTRNLASGAITSDKISDGVIRGNHIDIHSITGRNIFTTNIPYSVLTVREANGDALWSRVTGAMIETDTIDDSNIKDDAIISSKIKDNAVTSEKISDNSITTSKLADSSITTAKIQSGSITGTELANSIAIPGTPTLAITPSYSATAKELVNAEWVRYVIDHIDLSIPDRSILGRHLFTSDVKNRVLAVTETNANPVYTQINTEMILDNTISSSKMVDNSITTSKIVNNAITEDKIADDSITTRKIAEGEVKSINIFSSEDTNMILGVDSTPGHPVYTKVTSEMISNDAIISSKILDHAITTDKINPPADDHVVLSYVDDNSSPAWSKITTDMIADRSVTADKMFTSPDSNMILAVTTGNSSPVWTKITDALIDHITFDPTDLPAGSITHDKLAAECITNSNLTANSVATDNIQDEAITLGKIERPNTSGKLLGVSTGETTLGWVDIDTDMLADHIITPNKMWVSEDNYVVLGTVNAHTTPDYVKLNEHWFEDGAFSSRKLAANLVLYGTPELDQHPEHRSNNHSIASTAWVNTAIEEAIEAAGGFTPTPTPEPPDILPPGCVTEEILANNAVTSEKIKDGSIGANKFKAESIFDTVHIYDEAITTRKIADSAVTTVKIADEAITTPKVADGSITSGKLENAIVLPKNATVKEANINHKSLRNITISTDLPSGCTSGEIWFQCAT